MRACRSCFGHELEEVLDLGAQPWGNDFIQIGLNKQAVSYPLRLYFCHSCSMVQIDHTVPKELMFVDHSYMSGTTKSLKQHFESVGKMIFERYDMTGTRILDIGGNDGTFLEYFNDQGVQVLNVESAHRQATESQNKNIETMHEFFNLETAKTIFAEYGTMRVIHGSGVLFHLEELHSVFEGIEILLDENGVLIAEFIYLPGMVANCAYDQIYHEHLLYYSLFSLQKLLGQFGLEIFDSALVKIHGGSCVAHIARKGKYEPSHAFKSMLHAEISDRMETVGVYQAFGKKSLQQREIMQSTIADLKSANQRIHALGAPVKGSTIINFCDLSNNEIECAVEINPYKFGTYVPGTLIPVLDEHKVEPPDVYLLLAWNFAEEILPRFANFRASSGKFLIPIPTPKLI